MNTYRHFKPSEILRAMCIGIKAAERRKDFHIYMLTFGQYIEGICYGCAATCTIQELTGKWFTNEKIENDDSRARMMNIDMDELLCLETAVDTARQGYLYNLYKYCGLSPELYKPRFQVTGYHENRDRFFSHINQIIVYLKEIKL